MTSVVNWVHEMKDCLRAKAHQIAQWWWRRCSHERIVIVFLVAICVWLVWPLLPWALRIESGFHCAYVVNTYVALQALIAIVGLPLLYVSYVGAKKRGRDDEFKRIELDIVKSLYPMLRDYQDAIDSMEQTCLDKKCRRGTEITVYLYDKYRVRELQLLCALKLSKSIDKKKELWFELSKIDADFCAESQCLLKPHQLISVALNWAKCQVEYMQNLYSGDGYTGYSKKISEMKVRILEVFKSYTKAGHRFLLAKYRHHEHSMDKRNYIGGEVGYRGFEYADYLFAYSRTLAHIGFRDENTARKYWNQTIDSYSREPNGIQEDKQLWVNCIHVLSNSPDCESLMNGSVENNVQHFSCLTENEWRRRNPLPGPFLPEGVNEWDWYS